MSNPSEHPTVIWAALIVSCESGSIELPEDDPSIDYAEQMQESGLLVCTGEREWTLSSKGFEMSAILERLRDFSLSRL